MLWSRVSDGVILTSFIGHTSPEEMREAISRLEKTGAKVLGTVVNNVRVTKSYNRYGYGYNGYADNGGKKRGADRKKSTSKLLLSENVDKKASKHSS